MEEARRLKALRDEQFAQLEAEEEAMEKAMEPKEEKLAELEKGTMVHDETKSAKDRSHWTIEKKLGEGAFGKVYVVTGEKMEKMAMKTEPKKTGGMLKIEKEVMSALKGRPNVVQLGDSGVWGVMTFIVMTLVGIDLEKLKGIMEKSGGIGEPFMLQLWIRALESLKELHESGYLHRDLKLENICLARTSENLEVYLLDFGLCRRYVTEVFGTLKLRRPRASPAFRGNLLNAARRAHNRQDICRADDVESMFYVFLGVDTELPWNHCDNGDLIRIWKTERMNQVLSKATSPVFKKIWAFLEKSTFTCRPKYHKIYQILTDRLAEMKVKVTSRPKIFEELVKNGLMDAAAKNGGKLVNEDDEKKELTMRFKRVEVGDGEALLAPLMEDFFGIEKPEKPKKQEKKCLPSTAAAKTKTTRRRK